MLLSLVRQRCPRCFRGAVFHGWMAMHESCPTCGYRFEKEPGYFVGAMYVSYALAVPAYALLVALFLKLLAGRPDYWAFGAAFAAFLPLTPLIFRYSRVLWMYFDRILRPGSF